MTRTEPDPTTIHVGGKWRELNELLEAHESGLMGQADDIESLRIKIRQLQKVEVNTHHVQLGDLLRDHDAKLDDLRAEVEQLQEAANAQGSTELVVETSAPVWRERVNLDSTIKDGYRVKDVTVEVTYSEGERPTRAERRKRLMEAIADGQVAADRMNHERQQQQRFSN